MAAPSNSASHAVTPRERASDVVIHVIAFFDADGVKAIRRTARRFGDAVVFALPRSLAQTSRRYTELFDQRRPLVEEIKRLGLISASREPGSLDRRARLIMDTDSLGDQMDRILYAWDVGISIWESQGLTPDPPSPDRPEDFRELLGLLPPCLPAPAARSSA